MIEGPSWRIWRDGGTPSFSSLTRGAGRRRIRHGKIAKPIVLLGARSSGSRRPRTVRHIRLKSWWIRHNGLTRKRVEAQM